MRFLDFWTSGLQASGHRLHAAGMAGCSTVDPCVGTSSVGKGFFDRPSFAEI